MNIKLDYDYPDSNQIIAASKQKRGKAFLYTKLKRDATNYTLLAVREYMKLNGLQQLKERVKITCNWYRKDKRKDPDNISGGIKFILDGLVKAGLMEDDRMKNISEINHKFFKSDNKKNYVIVELEEV